MQIDIQLNKNLDIKSNATLFNYLGKAVTALSIPLFIYGFPSFSDLVKSTTEKKESSFLAVPKTLKDYSLLASILLSSAGLAFRKKYVLEKSLQQEFVTNDKNLQKMQDIIDKAKADLSADKYGFDAMRDANPHVLLPSLNDVSHVFPYLFLKEDEIEKLSPSKKTFAYLSQIKCMQYFMAVASGRSLHHVPYEPNIPVANTNKFGQDLYHVDDILDVLRKDHAAASVTFALATSGLRFEIDEIVNKRNVKESIDKRLETNGAGTILFSAVIPLIPASYSTLTSLIRNFADEVPDLTGYNMQYSPITDLEHDARRICDMPPKPYPRSIPYAYRETHGALRID